MEKSIFKNELINHTYPNYMDSVSYGNILPRTSYPINRVTTGALTL